jgi:hypothetical protein
MAAWEYDNDGGQQMQHNSEWTAEDERTLSYALNSTETRPLVRVLTHKYGYDYEDVKQEARIASLKVLRKRTDLARNTIINRATHYRLLHLCRYEGKRDAETFRLDEIINGWAAGIL